MAYLPKLATYSANGSTLRTIVRGRFFMTVAGVAFWCLLSGSLPATAQDRPVKNVLVLHSYHRGLGWTDGITKSIEQTFAEGPFTILFYYEFMDTKRISDDFYLHSIYNLYKYKYRKKKFDVIIASDDHAFRFILNKHAEIFPETPAVFCGVDYFEDSMIRGDPYITGVVEAFSIKGTIDAALRVHPGTTEIVTVVDETVSGRAIKKFLTRTIIPAYRDRLKFRVLSNLEMAEMQTGLSRLPENDIVLLLNFTTDRSGNVFTTEKSADLITKHCNRPVYGCWAFYLNHGVIGGKLATCRSQGRLAAEIALRILKGEKPADIPVVKNSPAQYTFDYNVLEHFGVDPGVLPEGSMVINQPYSFYRDNKTLFWVLVGAVVLLSILVPAFVVNSIRRRNAEISLRSSEDKFRSLVETTSDWIWEVDQSARYVYVSPSIKDLLGYEPEDILGKTPFDLMPPDEAERVKVAFFELRWTYQPINRIENICRHRDGRLVTLETTGVPIFNKDGNFKGYRGIDRDITERRKAEDALRKSEERFRELAGTLHHVFYLFDNKEQRLIYVSPAYETVWGRSAKDLLNRFDEWADSVHPDDREEFRESYKRILKNPEGEIREYRITRHDGENRWVLDRGIPIINENGDVNRVAGIVEDITDRKKTEQALRDSEHRFREMAELLPEAVYELDLTGRVTFVNQIGMEQFGYTREDFEKGVIGYDLIAPEDRERAVLSAGKALQGESAKLNEYLAIRKDGSTFPVMARSSPISKDGRTVGLRGFLIDISERKKLESLVLEAQRLESIGTLAGGIAHDFNNLLMGIQGRVSLVLNDIGPSNPHYKHLKGIEDHVAGASGLTRQLLGFARAGKYDVKPTDLNDLLEKAVDMFGRARTELAISKQFQDDLWVTEVDQSQIDQVLFNIFVNAWQAMPRGGELKVETQNVVLDEDYTQAYSASPGRYVLIAVTDTGSGMDQETREKIFDPFFTTKPLNRGKGLGLASAYGIVKNHQGIITVNSDLNKGTRVNIYLPATHDMPIRDKKTPKALLKGDETVLLVDDEPMIVEVGEEMIANLGYQVITANGGVDAVEKYREHHSRIDIVVLDLVMPDLNGGQTFDQLRAVNPDVKVLLSSGYSINGEASAILSRGCNGFIQKPFNLMQLSHKLREVLDKE
jgi:two-component system cell cycle sensor histidine kinase/response regulator CckA